MASELELTRLVAGIRDDAEGKDLIAGTGHTALE